MSVASKREVYTSRIIKAGALLPDTRTLLAAWDPSASATENLQRLHRENVFGKASRARVEDVLRIFRQRYLCDEQVASSLVVLLQSGRLSAHALDRILYFHAVQSDPLLHDVVIEVLVPMREIGRTDVRVQDVIRAVRSWVDEGRTTSAWSDAVVERVAQGATSTLRDFGVLEGAVKKRLAPFYLPVEAFAYIALYLHARQPSGVRLLHHPEWRLFFLSDRGVERLFLEAQQHQLLEYRAAGSTIRIAFPARSLEEYARVITARAN